MADDFGFQPTASLSNDLGFQPIPKAPNTSGVQKMAQDNLAENDNKEAGTEPKPPLTPEQRLDTAAGMPVQNVLSGTAKPSDINAANRAQYVKALDNGSATNGGDWMQTMLHAIAPIVAGGIHRAEHPIDILTEAGKDVIEAEKGGASLLMYPFLSDFNKQQLLKNNQLTDYKDVENPTGPELERRAIELEQGIVGKAMGGLYAPLAALSPLISPIIESIGGKPLKPGESPTYQSNIPGIISAGMDMLGGVGIVHGAGELRAARTAGTQFLPGAGPWDNHPGSESIKDIVAKKLDKEPVQVTSQDIDQTIAQGSKDLHPAGSDFKNVETVTAGALKESTLHIIYKETGVKPDQVLVDAQHNPSIASDVNAGKVPEQYEHLVEEKPVATPDQTEKLQVTLSDTGKSFNVVDKDGDHVQGGFDSAEEARHYIEDEKFRAEERKAIEEEGKVKPTTEVTPAGEQTVIPGTEKITDKSLAERIMGKLLGTEKVQKPADEGLFDVAGRGQTDLLAGVQQAVEAPEVETPFTHKTKSTIPPSEIGKPTSLRTFLSNNGAKFNENNELISIRKDGKSVKGASAIEHAEEIAKEHGYLPKDQPDRPSETTLKNTLTENNGGRTSFREADTDRVLKAEEAKKSRENLDPSKIEHEAHNIGIDIEKLAGETDKQHAARLLDALKQFYKEQAGSGVTLRNMIGDAIIAAEKYAGKLTGGVFEKLANGYIKTFQPELIGPLAKRADAFLAKYKASLQEAQNAYYKQSSIEIRRWDKMSSADRMQWLYDHETGRWNEEENPDHARFQALLDATFKTEKESIGADAEKGYKENYLPHAWENPDAVKKYFNSDAYIKKYGKDGFTKRSTFELIQDGVRAGFKLKTDNPERMLVSRLLAGDNMLRTMDLLKDFEGSGVAKKATAFSIDKKIAKTQAAIDELREKYKKEFEKVNNPDQTRMENVPPAESKKMQIVQKRLDDLKTRLDDFNKEKSDNKLTPEQMTALKNGFKVIGPDSKVWNIHQEAGPLWKNAMEMKGLWENQGVLEDGYRKYMAGKAIWVRAKMLASLWHPSHEIVIDASSSEATILHHLIQGGKLSDLTRNDIPGRIGLTKNTLKLQDHPRIVSWDTAPDKRTPEQQADVAAMLEGGLVPKIPAQDAVRFRENFNKAINGVGLNNLRLIATALELPSIPMAPLMEHWIPGMKVDSYFQRRGLALARDPSLLNDAGKRAEVMRGIVQDIERNYGEMSRDTLFWNPIVKDAFNGAFFSGGWKLAMLQNVRGLAEPAKVGYNWLKTGEFSKEDITHQMLHSYIYTANMLMMGAGLAYLFTGAIGTIKDWMNPDTGEKNADGTPIRLRQPAFFNEPMMLLNDIRNDGVVAGTGSFIYHTSMIPGIADTLSGRDFVGRPYITDPTDLQQWKNMGWDSINPILISNREKAEERGSKVAERMGWLGFPMAGASINQSPFEQKIISAYDKLHPAEGSAYEATLKGEMKGAIINKDAAKEAEIESKMRDEGMTSEQISKSKKPFTKPFAEFAWTKLSAQDQKRLIESATDEEKKKFKVKSQ